MEAVRLSRLTTTLTLAVVGLAAGHVLLPYSAGGLPTTPGRRLAFWGVLVGVGAFRGWRDGAVRGEPPRRVAWRAALTALAAAALGVAAYWGVHGPLRGL